MRAIYPGRFQPFHLGHMHAVKSILEENDSILIIIENADESFTFRNPLTAGERFEMIALALKELNIKPMSVFIIPMENVKNNAGWVNQLRIMLPKFDVCYSNNDLVRILMENAGISVKGITFLEREMYQGSEIRRRIAKDLSWKNLVPESVYEYLLDNGIDRRIKNLAGMKE